MLPIPRLTTIAFNRHIRQQKGKRWADLVKHAASPPKEGLTSSGCIFYIWHPSQVSWLLKAK